MLKQNEKTNKSYMKKIYTKMLSFEPVGSAKNLTVI